MPAVSEWHIYRNEQQGRFAVNKQDKDTITDPLFYLDALTTDVTNKNFFRILDKKQYAGLPKCQRQFGTILKDH